MAFRKGPVLSPLRWRPSSPPWPASQCGWCPSGVFWMHPGRVWGASEVCLGCIWGVSGVHLGCVWGASGVCLGCVWGVSGVHPGCVWGSFGVHPGCVWGASGVCLGCIWGVFGVHLGCVWGLARKRRRTPGVSRKNRLHEKKLCTLLDLCVSSLRRGHANLLCIVPILTDDPRRVSRTRDPLRIPFCKKHAD